MPPLPRRSARLLLLHILSLPAALADSIWAGGPCLSACQLALNQVHFADTPVPASFLVRRCGTKLGVKSLFLCAELYCQDEDFVGGLASLNETCRTVDLPLPPLGIIAEYTDEEWEQVRRLEAGEAWGVVFNEPILPVKKFLGVAWDTLDAVDYVGGYHGFYANMMFWYWTAVVLIGVLRHTLHSLTTQSHGTSPRDPPQDPDAETLILKSQPRRRDYPSLYLRRFVTVPATFGYRCLQNVGWCTIPPRVESLTILLFAILNVGFCIHGYMIVDGNLYFGDVSDQLWRYVSDRTGILSWANFPVIFLFGMRNNLLMQLTGWDFGTFNNFHRWIARIATLQAVIHSVGYTVIVLKGIGGLAATIGMCGLLVASVFWLRRNLYEGFLIIHIVLSIIVLITMLLHVSIFGGEYDYPFWICTFIWIADRVLRVSRVLAFNPWFWNTRAELTSSLASNTVRLVVSCPNSVYKPQPGTYYYIYLLSATRFWESHPFTMAYSSRGHDPSEMESVSLLRDSASPPPTDASPPSLTFLIRPYDSFTARLRSLSASKPISPRVLIEGPYGTTHPLDQFPHVLFITGGSGIVTPLAYLSLLNRSPLVRSVRIIWSVREPGFADEVLREDIRDGFRDGKVSMDVFLTRGADGPLDPDGGWPKNVSVVVGRPDVTSEVQAAAQGAAGGRVAVVTCGPAKMADDSRRTVVEMLAAGFHGIEYFQEAFNW
ncbi:related to ferric reductase Fre2p [Cephalotrichum gorgonifer]|uniref:Related to ferric reductase Fre2p n=1 Tax=Cephalotrichum gorgonifer TaxID=2041049 RepID=A0AAE8T023_9PEZI|nr:related to ferric reductase Fre2p [Cephalotrichum gorgonifer]